jgi:hypothetical protein
MLRRYVRSAMLSLAVLLVPVAAFSQNEERNMASIITNLQTGGMNWNRFYPGVRQIIIMQTNGSGVYMQLRQLGLLQNVLLTGGWRLPAGFYYTFRARFQGGEVDWQIASDNAGNILALAFGAADQMPTTPNGTAPPSPNPAPITNAGTGPAAPASASEACSMFPDLCPST